MKKSKFISVAAIFLLVSIFGISENLFGQTPKKQVEQTSQSYSDKLKGHFILKGANCAGMEFTAKDDVVNFYADLQCSYPFKFRIHWLDKETFVLKDIDRINEDCPPRVYIYRVVSYVNGNLKLEELWTGWGEYKKEINTYIKKKR